MTANVSVQFVPEPGTAALVALGMVVLSGVRRRKTATGARARAACEAARPLGSAPKLGCD